MKVCNKCQIKKSLEDFYYYKKRNIFESICKLCKKKKVKEYYEDNSEQKKKKVKEYYEDNPEQKKKTRKEYYKNNLEKEKEKVKEYYKNNSEQTKKIRKEYYKNNSEKIKLQTKEYLKNNPEKQKEYNTRRYLKRKSHSKKLVFTYSQRKKILERDGWYCQHCKIKVHNKIKKINQLTKKELLTKACTDHIIPLSRGGETSLENGQILCWSCNCKKGNKLEEELDYLENIF